MELKKVNNAAYQTSIKIDASKPKQAVWYFINIIFFKNALNISSASKVLLLKMFGATIGQGVVVKPSVNIKYPWKLRIGNNSWIGEEVWIDNLSEVIIGANVTLSQGALILTGSHDHTKTTFDFISLPVILEEGVWIGAKAVVFGGVTCQSHSILGINSVAEQDMKAYIIYKGNPAIPVISRIIS
ncbi:MAG TPA: WcaF family extracellular polysaccharide biosynthesis acetyltransferase [Ferruginibacter sp.]|jgi:putative colanic acid biosynthesis acetyltransferase WcaF|nr:WcaF family extracellular polysaccharide biosynthesis acetyltransferase [Ferruginibacter sp.]